jgi:alanine racemase
MIMADVTHIPQTVPGDEAVFLGRQESLDISGDELAAASKTISYEVFCSIGQRHKRIILT